MASAVLLVSLLLISCLAAICHGATFSSLQKTLVVTASPKNGQDLKAGEDSITLTWSFNTSFPARTDSAYRTVQVKLCYAPISQQDRAWRKTEDNLVKDKTCQHKIVEKPYGPSNNNFTWTVQRDVPTGTYFVRAYAYNSEEEEVAYGQTTDTRKTTNLFQVEAISGRHVSLDIASICFSAFAVVSLFGFFLLEKRRTNNSQKK
ncbi:high-affinity nitrate transporter 3.2-like [Olea europaea var. sylvestris]|uniref:High-affinity nitrate transporter n=1 Tax=Olea europaea subsp. europaea TaxID=158383 RepID=A0A8S0PTY1_OLEEU|nr:high-affinity nitrate transporter 3.2-like [Olea europaea var. sylvestris]CAA2957924.1 high-affinity nitrate transporter -like [Olea europaea subsp. europaea]